MKIEGKEYRTIWYEGNIVKIIDQTKLPHQFIIKELKSVNDAINAIKTMEVRGAPLIGGTAAYGIGLALQESNNLEFIKKSAKELILSRPTAINLKWAVDRMMKKIVGINSDEILPRYIVGTDAAMFMEAKQAKTDLEFEKYMSKELFPG